MAEMKTQKETDFFADIIASIDSAGKVAPLISCTVKEIKKKNVLENVFDVDNVTGAEVIFYLSEYQESLNLNQPTVEAYNAETSLVTDIRRCEASKISLSDLMQTVNKYIQTHARDKWQGDWTGEDVPLCYLQLIYNGEQLDAYTCNAIQEQIITALWQTKHPEATTRAIKI